MNWALEDGAAGTGDGRREALQPATGGTERDAAGEGKERRRQIGPLAGKARGRPEFARGGRRAAAIGDPLVAAGRDFERLSVCAAHRAAS